MVDHIYCGWYAVGNLTVQNVDKTLFLVNVKNLM